MPNPLDIVTQDDSNVVPFDQKMQGINIRPYDGGPDVASGGNNALTQAMAPEAQSWTMDDLFKGLAALKEYVGKGEFSPGTKVGNRLFGTGGEQRYQIWPEKVVRSGVGAAGNALSSLEPVTSEQLIAPAMDMAGMAGGSALIERPGAASLGSGPVRPAPKAMSTGPAPVFYSALEHAATNAAQDVMSPQQWLGYLKNQPGVKQEELQWTGIGDWLAGQKGKVKKADVRRYLDEHKVEIKDVTKKGSDVDELGNFIEENHDMLRAEAERDVRRADPELERQDPPRFADAVEDTINEIADDHIRRAGEGTKYSDYQLPGGENYREHLLTLPQKERDIPWSRDKGERLRALDRKNEQGTLTGPELDEHMRLSVEANARDRVPAPYHSSHWDEPNVLAHVRTNDRTIDGKKVLHIEEIQSDWHQQGRKQGYKSADDGHMGPLGVPDAPFKTSWPELALKRMIRKAAEEGYDRISWTPGEAQAARYDLSKTLDTLKWSSKDDEYGVIGMKDGKAVVTHSNIPKHKLQDYVGKEAAEKITNGDAKGELSNLDLKVGGEGMREFYDKMLPKMVEKIGRAHGVKVKQGQIGEPSTLRVIKAENKGFRVDDPTDPKAFGRNGWFATRAEAEGFIHSKGRGQHPVHYFDIPQSLRDHAVGKGFPLYMTGVPFPLVPVDHDPFKKQEK